MDQGQAAPPVQATATVAPPVLPAPLPPLRALRAAPAPPAFALAPGCSHAILNYNDPNTGATATKLYNKAISPLKEKFDREAGNLALFLAVFVIELTISIGIDSSLC